MIEHHKFIANHTSRITTFEYEPTFSRVIKITDALTERKGEERKGDKSHYCLRSAPDGADV